MKLIETSLAGVVILEPRIFGDERGFFFESYNKKIFAEADLPADFVQDNHSHSEKNVLRGLHYQIRQPQGKLVRVARGEIFDVAVDVRKDSPNFGKWTSARLSEKNKHMLWIPPGFAHGFCVVSESADVLYKTTDYWAPEYEQSILWSDPQLAIEWPLTSAPILSARDKAGHLLKDALLSS